MHHCSTSNNRMSSGQFSIHAAVTSGHNEKRSLCSCLWQSAGMGQLKHPSNLFKTFYFSIKSIPARRRCSMICDSADNQYSADLAFSLSCHRFLLCHINIIIYRLKFTCQSSKKYFKAVLFLFSFFLCTAMVVNVTLVLVSGSWWTDDLQQSPV